MTKHSPRNKQPFIISELTRMAGEYGPGMKLPTAQQLARKFEVTLTTLDRSLAKLEAKGIIHRRQGSGIYVSDHLLHKRIGLLFGRNIFRMGSSTFYLLLLQHCEKRAEQGQQQFSFFLAPSNKTSIDDASLRNQDLSDSLKQGKLDGLILCEVDDPAYEDWLHKQGISAIAFAPARKFPTVEIDTQRIIELACENLAARGCKSVGLLGILAKHEQLFRQAAPEYGLHVHEPGVIHPEDEKDPPFDSHEPLGREWMQRCIKQCGGPRKLPDGLVVTDDILARGACLHLKDIGIHPGKELQIASHANKGSLALEYWQDSLILLEIAPESIVDAMFDMLETMMAGRALKRKHVRIEPNLRA